jgi:hypothetical protein
VVTQCGQQSNAQASAVAKSALGFAQQPVAPGPIFGPLPDENATFRRTAVVMSTQVSIQTVALPCDYRQNQLQVFYFSDPKIARWEKRTRPTVIWFWHDLHEALLEPED